MVNVEFEWFNFKPEIDFHGTKTLLRQLFDVDHQLFDLSGIAESILNQATIGSTVKVDGEETDPYAFLTVLNLAEHRKNQAINTLIEYFAEKSKSSEGLSRLFNSPKPSQVVGLILSERMINVPSQIAPPMYTMLIDEIEAAVEDKEPYQFTHYLILSKTYREVASSLDQEDAPKSKKSRAGKMGREIFYFHPEDEVLQRHAQLQASFEYTKDEGEGMADSKRAFQEMGIKTQGLMMLIEASKFAEAVKAVDEYLSPPQ
jgi:protein BCP1